MFPMGVANIPKEVQRFLARHIQSIAQLEALLHMRSEETGTVTAESFGKEKRVTLDLAAELLEDLAGRGFLQRTDDSPPSYGYEPMTAEMAKQVDALASAYASYRVTIIDMVFSGPNENIQSFADAFKLRREDD